MVDGDLENGRRESSILKDGRTEPECHAAGQRERCSEKANDKKRIKKSNGLFFQP